MRVRVARVPSIGTGERAVRSGPIFIAPRPAGRPAPPGSSHAVASNLRSQLTWAALAAWDTAACGAKPSKPWKPLARRGVRPLRPPARGGTRRRRPRRGRFRPSRRPGRPGEVREVLRPGRGRVRGDVGAAAAVAEEGGPAGLVGRAVPDADARHLVRGRGVVAVVEHRAQEELADRARAAPVPGQQGQRRRQAAARARAHDDDPCRVAADLLRVLRRPQQSGVHVLDRRRMRVLGREPVLHRHHHRVQLPRVLERPAHPDPPVAEDHPAAVHVVDDGQRARCGGRGRAADQQCDGGFADRPGDLPVLDGEGPVQGQVQLQRLGDRRAPADLVDVLQRHPGRDELLDQFQCRGEFRVERGRRRDGGHGFLLTLDAAARTAMVRASTPDPTTAGRRNLPAVRRVPCRDVTCCSPSGRGRDPSRPQRCPNPYGPPPVAPHTPFPHQEHHP